MPIPASISSWLEDYRFMPNPLPSSLYALFLDPHLLAMILYEHFPSILNPHSFTRNNSRAVRFSNWENLRTKILPKIGVKLSNSFSFDLVEGNTGIIQAAVGKIMKRIKIAEEKKEQSRIHTKRSGINEISSSRLDSTRIKSSRLKPVRSSRAPLSKSTLLPKIRTSLILDQRPQQTLTKPSSIPNSSTASLPSIPRPPAQQHPIQIQSHKQSQNLHFRSSNLKITRSPYLSLLRGQKGRASKRPLIQPNRSSEPSFLIRELESKDCVLSELAKIADYQLKQVERLEEVLVNRCQQIRFMQGMRDRQGD